MPPFFVDAQISYLLYFVFVIRGQFLQRCQETAKKLKEVRGVVCLFVQLQLQLQLLTHCRALPTARTHAQKIRKSKGKETVAMTPEQLEAERRYAVWRNTQCSVLACWQHKGVSADLP